MMELCYLHWIHAKWDQPVRLSLIQYRILIYQHKLGDKSQNQVNRADNILAGRHSAP